MNTHESGKSSINEYLSDTISSVFFGGLHHGREKSREQGAFSLKQRQNDGIVRKQSKDCPKVSDL